MKKLLLLILLPISVFAQKDTSFWFAAPDVTEFNVSNPYDRPILLRLTTFSIAATVTVSIPSNSSFVPITISISPNSTGTIDLSNWANLIENSVANTISDKGIKIGSTAEITAYYEINSSCNCNPELFALKGKNALGNEFIIPSQTEWSVDTLRHPTATSAFNIVATENNTVVKILPSKYLVGRAPNTLFSIILNKGQTFSSQALYRSAASLLNGSIVTSDKPIAVTADEDLLMADGTCADLAGDQLIPTAIWGNEFIVVKGNLTNKDKIVITASVNGTSIFLDGNSTAATIINRGSSYELNLAAAATLYIKTSNHVSVYHYTGISCEIGSAVIPKISCTGSFDVAITRSSNENAVAFLVTKNGYQSAFTVNGNSTALTNTDFLPVPGTAGNYVYCKKNLDFVMPTGNATRFINTLGKFQIGFLNGGTTYGGCSYGFFSDFKSSNVARSQLEICKLDSAQLNAFGGVSYQWSPSTGLSNTSTANPKASPSITTDYKVIITTAEGCIDSAFIKVMITTGTLGIDFSYKQNTCNPLSVQFFNIGNSPANTYWSFGDGNTNTGSTSPVHVYAAPGNFTVKYGFQNGTCIDTVIKNISVNILQSNIILTTDTTICYKSSKQLLTVPSLSFCWSPTSFLNDPLSPNPITSTPGPITYYFTAEIPGTNIINNGNFSAGNVGFISAYNYAASNTTEGEYFVGSSPQAWNASLSNCSDHTTGTGNMLLVNGSPAANVKVWTQTVTVTPNTNYAFSSWIQALYPPNPALLSFSINGADAGNLISASLPACNWTQFYTTWNSGNSTSAIIAIINKNTQVQGNDFALDDISFAPVLIKRDSVKITIDTPLVRTLTDTATCKGKPVQLTSTGATQYSWTPAAGLSNASVSNPIATPADTTRYIVTGTNARGCIAKDTVMVFVKKLPVISRSANDTVCINQSVQLFATGGVNYSWLPANTLNNAGIANPIATPAATTTYKVVVTGANNCVNTDSVKITTKAMPAFTVNADTATCVNGKAQLNAGGGTSYLWSPASMLNNATISNPVATVSINTNFTVIIKDNICNLADTLFTRVSTDLALPDIVAAKSNDMDCVFRSVQLSVTGADVYVWTPATDLSGAAIANPVATPTISRQYKVVGTNITNNCSSTDTITVFVKAPAAPKSYIPNSFTPNGDGINDCFKVGDFGTIKTVDITICNRYGNVVFHTKNATLCWDGKYKGQPAEVGNYVYYIKVLNNCGEEIKKGNLLLFR